jgi:hypothetical protein
MLVYTFDLSHLNISPNFAFIVWQDRLFAYLGFKGVENAGKINVFLLFFFDQSFKILLLHKY